MDPFTRIAELESLLKDAHQEVEKLRHDCITGLIGRQTFEELLQATFVPRRADDGLIGIIMCDIDHFKDVNDEHGHSIGDEVIGIVAQAIKACVRSTDHVARYGGEEYVSIVARSSNAGLAHLSERIRAAVEMKEHPGCPKVTISVGFSLQLEDDENAWDVVERADQALYIAKNTGRNRVGHETLGPQELHLIEKIEKLRRKKTHE